MTRSVTRQDTLAENETVLLELEDGSRLLEVEDTASYQDRFEYHVETVLGDDTTLDDERRARLWIHLYDIADGFSTSSPQVMIPIDVVVDGKPAVATYLYAVEGWDSEDVADRLDVSKRTVWDYLSEIRGRSDVDEA